MWHKTFKVTAECLKVIEAKDPTDAERILREHLKEYPERLEVRCYNAGGYDDLLEEAVEKWE